MSSKSGDAVARNRNRIPDSAPSRRCSHAVTTRTPTRNGMAAHRRSATGESPADETVNQPTKLNSWWSFGTYGPARIAYGPRSTYSVTVWISSQQ